jgi:hypothetical protein
MLAAPPAMAELKVHVNRVALEADGPKSALVESDQAGASGEFTVLRDGKPVLEAPLVAQPDLAEWGASRHYYLADFSQLVQPGRYRVRARVGEERAQSTEIVVTSDALFKVTAGALIDYFRQGRWLDTSDHHIHVFGTDRWVDVWGGWRDAGGDNGKYLSHLSYANFFNPQQAGMTAWTLARVHEAARSRLRAAGLERALVEEALYGADFMHRLLSSEGYFYMTVFEGWGRPGAERAVTGYVGEEGTFTRDYQAAMREGPAWRSPRSRAPRGSRARPAWPASFPPPPTWRMRSAPSRTWRSTTGNTTMTGSRTSSMTTRASWRPWNCTDPRRRLSTARRRIAVPRTSWGG